MSTQQQMYHHHNHNHHQYHQHHQQQQINKLSTTQLITHIEQISIMLVTAVAILTVLILLYKKKNNQKKIQRKQEKYANTKSRNEHERGYIPQRQNNIATTTKRYTFSVNDQYQKFGSNNNNQYNNNNSNISNNNYQPQHYQPPLYTYQSQHHRQHDQTHLTNLLHQQNFNNQPYPSPQQYYSLKQQKQTFLNNLNLQKKLTETGVYLDQQDLQERRMRKLAIQQRKHLLIEQQRLKQLQASNVKGKVTTAGDGKEKDVVKQDKKKQQQQQKQPKLQEKKPTPPLGEKTLFAENKAADKTQPQVATLPSQGGIDFSHLTLNLQSEKTLPKGTQPTKGLFGNVQATNVTNSNVEPSGTAKKEQKPLIFPNMNVSGSLFGSQTSGEQKPGIFATGQQQPQGSLFGNKEPNITQKPVEKKEQSTVPSKPQPSTTGTSQPVLPQTQTQLQPQPPKPSTLPQPSLPSAPQKIQKKDYLQMLINYSNSSKEHCQLKKTKTNNFGRSISNLKQIYDTSIDFINTINIGDSKQVQTLACVIYDFLINKTIPTWPKQEGWQMFPPRSKNQTQWKISITTYVLKLNLYRAMGHENLWLIVFGKLLSLLDFTWKRDRQIPKSSTAYKELDFVKNGYFSLQKQDDMAPKYFTRLDLVTYFLFCMTTFDPQLVAEYLCQTAGQDKHTFEEIKKLKYKWSYNYFWILVETILANKTKTYFKPILYMNILSSMYLQIRKNKLNSNDFKDFDHLRKYITKEAIEYTNENELERNDEVQTLAELDQQTRDFRFDGEDFLGQIETLNFYFKEKDGEYKKASVDRKGFEEFEKRCSVFDFFKSQSKLG